jgi:hypothetical protein
MLISSKSFRVIAKQILPLLASNCNKFRVQTYAFHNLINSNLNCHMVVHMRAMLMIMIWDVNACLTPRGVTQTDERQMSHQK